MLKIISIFKFRIKYNLSQIELIKQINFKSAKFAKSARDKNKFEPLRRIKKLSFFLSLKSKILFSRLLKAKLNLTILNSLISLNGLNNNNNLYICIFFKLEKSL